MSWQATAWAAKQKTGGPSGKSVILVLANYADPWGVSWPSQKLMADETEQSVDTVQRRLKDLIELNLLRMETRAYRPRGGTVGHIYYLRMPKSDIEATPQDAVLTEEGTPQIAAWHTAPGPESTPHLCGIEESKEPLIEPSLSERENSKCISDLGPQIAEFLAAWPTASTDSHSKINSHWGKLSVEDRKAAIAGISPFLAELKKNGRERIISGWKYLAERRWALIIAPASDVHGFDTWSRDWWAVLLAKLDRGERANGWFNYADLGGVPAKRFCAVKPADMPGIDQLAILSRFPSDGESLAAWRPWFAARGLRLPIWSERFWIFLPGATPPIGKQSIWSRRTP